MKRRHYVCYVLLVCPVSETKKSSARRQLARIGWLGMVQHPHTLRCNTHLQTPQNSRDTLSILYGVRRGGTHAARHYCTLAARRGRSSSLEVEGRELDAAAGGRSEGLLAQRKRLSSPRSPQAAEITFSW